MEGILAAAEKHIRALLFDLDEGEDHERGPNELYTLGINLLYVSEPDEPTAERGAQKAAEALEKLFEEAFNPSGNGWRKVCLQYCDPISDSAMTVAQSERLKQWRLEHMSLRDDPPQPTFAS